MQFGLIQPSAANWAQALSERRHDVYHLPTYVELSGRRLEDGEPCAFFAEEDDSWFLVPLIIRPVPLLIDGGPALFDATSPYGYPGPLLNLGQPGDGDQFLDRALEAFVATLCERRIIAAFIRLHPLLTLPLASLARIGRLVPHGETISIDLHRPRDELWSQTRQNHRRDINRAIRSGQIVRIDESREAFDVFIDLYYQTMRRLSAERYYYFPPDFLTELKSTLGESLHLCTVEMDGQSAAAGLFTEVCGIVEYYLSGTADEFVSAHPLKTMLNFVRDWAQERGNQVFHLGGGLGGLQDTLYHFKAGFSQVRHPFLTWRVVADETAYREVVERWQIRSERRADPVAGFFPAYRDPATNGPTSAGR